MHFRKTQDIIQGEKKEKELYDIIIKQFKPNTLTKTEQYHPLDYYDDVNTYYEIKSRNNYLRTYPDTMIGNNKFEYVKKHKLECYFIINFFDGSYYYKYDENDEFDIRIGGRNDRGEYEYKPYVYIPINKLIKI